jgi:hypothetical protein
VAVPGTGDQLENDATGRRFRDPGAQSLHPTGRLGLEQGLRPAEVLNTF